MRVQPTSAAPHGGPSRSQQPDPRSLAQLDDFGAQEGYAPRAVPQLPESVDADAPAVTALVRDVVQAASQLRVPGAQH